MDTLKQIIEQILTASGLNFSLETDSENSRINIFFHEDNLIKEFLPKLVFDFEHVIKIIAKKLGIEKVNVDVNNYKKERERLISELAKAAARKVLAEKRDIELPAMNAYERRIVHMELATRPDVKTESVGEGPSRHIVVKSF